MMGTPKISAMRLAAAPEAVKYLYDGERPRVEAAWLRARAKLKAMFPRVPTVLWDELGAMTIDGPDHRISRQNDPYVHAYLLSQEFGMVVQKIISDEVGFIPLHAKHGCAGGPASPGLRIAIIMQGFENINLDALQNDFQLHIDAEVAKFRAVGLI